jgi:ATP adenylyltransferase
VAHNVLLSPSWLIVVPRRCPGVDGVNINAVGYAGMMLVARGALDTVGPMAVLRGCAFPQ